MCSSVDAPFLSFAQERMDEGPSRHLGCVVGRPDFASSSFFSLLLYAAAQLPSSRKPREDAGERESERDSERE